MIEITIAADRSVSVNSFDAGIEKENDITQLSVTTPEAFLHFDKYMEFEAADKTKVMSPALGQGALSFTYALPYQVLAEGLLTAQVSAKSGETVWKSDIFSLRVKPGVNATEFIAEHNPDILQDLEERIEELESAGVEGASAYEVAAQNGFNGTKEEWLDSLVGPQGISGPAGADGLTTSVNFVEQVVGNISLTCDDIPEKAENPTKLYYTPERVDGRIHEKIVNNLTAGGTSSVLSAEQGKVLNSKINNGGNTAQLIEKIIVGYSTTTDTVFITGKTYYQNTGTFRVPVYTALGENTDWTAGGSQTISGVSITALFEYSGAGVTEVIRTVEPDGTPYAFKAGMINTHAYTASENGSFTLIAYMTMSLYTGVWLSTLRTAGETYAKALFYPIFGYWQSYGSTSAGLIPGYAGTMVAVGRANVIPVSDYPTIYRLRVGLNSATKIPSGTEIEFWGVR